MAEARRSTFVAIETSYAGIMDGAPDLDDVTRLYLPVRHRLPGAQHWLHGNTAKGRASLAAAIAIAEGTNDMELRLFYRKARELLRLWLASNPSSTRVK